MSTLTQKFPELHTETFVIRITLNSMKNIYNLILMTSIDPT